VTSQKDTNTWPIPQARQCGCCARPRRTMLATTTSGQTLFNAVRTAQRDIPFGNGMHKGAQARNQGGGSEKVGRQMGDRVHAPLSDKVLAGRQWARPKVLSVSASVNWQARQQVMS
jgi:hypothetical protein